MRRLSQSDGWSEVDAIDYKDEPGTWVGVRRRPVFGSKQAEFETRVFELQAGGYTTYEKHEHEHCVCVLRGSGKVRLGVSWHELKPLDWVVVEPWVPHQFVAEEAMEIICIVNRERDRPLALCDEAESEASI